MEADIIVKEESFMDADEPNVFPLTDPLELSNTTKICQEHPQADLFIVGSEPENQHLNAICLSIRIAIIRCFYKSSNCPTTALQMLKKEDNELCVTINVEDINFFVQKFEKTGSVICDHMDLPSIETEDTMNPHSMVETVFDDYHHTKAVDETNKGMAYPIEEVSEDITQLSQAQAKECIANLPETQKHQFQAQKEAKRKKACLNQTPKCAKRKKNSQRFPPLGKNQCRICKKKCPDRPSFTSHFLSHFNMTFLPKGRPHKCPACDKTFACNSNLYVHLFCKCLLENCDFSQDQQNSKLAKDTPVTLNPSLSKSHNENDCESSEQSFFSLQDQVEQSELDTDNMSLSQNSKKKVFKCPRCPEILPNVRSLNYHFTNHFNLAHLNGDPPYNCPACDQLFHTKQTLYKHLRTSCHKGKRRPETPFRCSTCSRAFQFEIQYEHHLLVHSGKAKLKECHYCGKKFKTTTGFRNHLISNHREKKAFQCDQCPKFFINSRHLEEHKLSHSGTYLYTCDKCGKQYDTVSSYQSHLHTHINKSKRWQCEICGKDFSGSYDYSKHKLIHTGEVKAVCDHCGKGFSRKDNLKVHVKSCQKRHQ